MQFANRLVGLMCHLSALVWNSLEYRLHPKQESFIKQLSSYEIITPLRVNDFGETFPHALHYRRRRRSADAGFSGLRAHYRIDAFGQRFHLNLTADSGFIAPSYTVTHLGVELSNYTDSQQDGTDMRHCFFSGHVNSKSDFPAVFSLCTGLIGTFTTHSGEYFLEPLLNSDGSVYEDEHSKPHLMYHRERKGANRGPSSPGNRTEPCAATGSGPAEWKMEVFFFVVRRGGGRRGRAGFEAAKGQRRTPAAVFKEHTSCLTMEEDSKCSVGRRKSSLQKYKAKTHHQIPAPPPPKMSG
ncbi:hypothetical protein GJAV_G00164710 [Gymnothorax javanicus]|nr:hypothetical protein GJAV_G00164710 [Gymnothorax javanicus]